MQIKTFKGGYDSNFAYLCIEQDQALLIDPSVPAEDVLNHCESNNLHLQAVVVMHSHHDHIIDLKKYKKLGIPIIAHQSIQFPVDRKVGESDKITLNNNSFTVMHTPGHRFDCICLYNSKYKSLFTSDTLFVGGCGRVDFPGSDPEVMLETLERLKHLPDDTIIYPGHDYGKTSTSTIGEEKIMNPYLKMTRDQFLRQRLNY